MHAKIIIPTANVSHKNKSADLKKAGTFGTLVNILRMIRPRRVAYPTFITITRLYSRTSSTLAPSTIHDVSDLVCNKSLAGNLPTGMLSPVKLASFTNTSPEIRIPS